MRVIEEEEIDLYKEFRGKINQTIKDSSEEENLEKEKKKFEKELSQIRDRRRKFRAMLYDSLVERDNIIKAHLERAQERRMIVEKTHELDPNNNGVDVFLFLLFLIQIAIIICYIIFLKFPNAAITPPLVATNNTQQIFDSKSHSFSELKKRTLHEQSIAQRTNPDGEYLDFYYISQSDFTYAHYVNIAMMVFIGFNLFMSLLKKFAWGTLGLNLLIGSFAIQWGILCHVFFMWAFKGNFTKVAFTLDVLIHGAFVAAACLISHASLLGRINEVQSIVLVFLEVIGYTVNFNIGQTIGVRDPGGASWIFLFASSLGFVAAWVYSLTDKNHENDVKENRSYSYWQGGYALMGAIVIWIMFPSFNSVFAPIGTQSRVIGVTVLSLAASTVSAIAVGHLLHGSYFIKTFINATLTGGIIAASGISLVVDAYSAMIVSAFVAAFITVLSDWVIRPKLEENAKLIDTQGIFGTIFLSSVIACIVGIIALASPDRTESFSAQFSNILNNGFSGQAKRNTATAFISLGIGVGSGLIIGLVLALFRNNDGPSPSPYYTDDIIFKTPMPDDFDDF